EFAVFTGKSLFDSAVKKVSHMGVLLRLGDAQLPFAGVANDLPQNVFEFFRSENEWRRIAYIILRERDETNLRPHFAIEPVEVLKQKRLRKLPRAIGTKIEKQNRVAVAQTLLD